MFVCIRERFDINSNVMEVMNELLMWSWKPYLRKYQKYKKMV